MLIETCHLHHTYQRHPLFQHPITRRVLQDVNLQIRPGETLALVGGSGSGKSTLARLLCGLEKPSQGKVLYQKQDIAHLTPSDKKAFQRDVQMVFQDSFSAVDPNFTVGEIIQEPLDYLTQMNIREKEQRVLALLALVGLSHADRIRKPHQMSGGQLQRVCLARALAPSPSLIILDESLSGLDRLLQSQLMKYLQQIQQQTGVAYLFITHDLRLVHLFCQHVVVMHQGSIVECQAVSGPLQFNHPAAKALQDAILPPFPVRPAEHKNSQLRE
ncbi:Nickel import ATP-binding protein NikE [Vibrio aerogenes CECT 7868]|uniref:Nickel import ATP-binding protein NikE n=1 Tax=Vibrio aerogenes CECT 7868 TaxID=1216006 RepID=A0A1M5ZHJ3_9VIBR|nr:nickel import ATP-binding protein NikE [Vibrio aerogenes]SHI23765.1 Nickel import ATP-binding protein NikE [Vibrio aerogenes CECT 7868]